MSDLVGNIEDRFSSFAAHISLICKAELLCMQQYMHTNMANKDYFFYFLFTLGAEVVSGITVEMILDFFDGHQFHKISFHIAQHIDYM